MSKKDKSSTSEKKITKHFNNLKQKTSKTISDIDAKTNPKHGKILYLVSKWTTILIFIIVIPLFVLFYQFSINVDKYTFSANLVLSQETPVKDVLRETPMIMEVDYTVNYDYIDSSIQEVENLDSNQKFSDLDSNNLFLTTCFYNNDDNEVNFEQWSSTGDSVPFFFAYVYTPTSSNYTYENWQADAKVWPTIFTKDDFNQKLGFDAANAEPSVSDVQSQFRKQFPPQGGLNYDENVSQTGSIVGWVLIVFGLITSLLWFWFSKFSQVQISKPKKTSKEKK